MTLNIRRICVAVLLLSATALLAQQDFSGDMVSTEGQEAKLRAKVYVSKTKMRIETQDPGHQSTMIFDFATQTSDLLRPAQKMYIEFSLDNDTLRHLGTFFRPSDVEDACGEWQKLASSKGGTCKKIGNETVNGRKTVKYEGSFADGHTNYVWLDTTIAYPIKWQGQTSAGELRNISEGPQPASLFTVPSDYHKMQMPAGMPNAPQQH